jgi:hypothetical protein
MRVPVTWTLAICAIAVAMDYQVTFVDPATWTAPWTAALDMKGSTRHAPPAQNSSAHSMQPERTAGRRAAESLRQFPATP